MNPTAERSTSLAFSVSNKLQQTTNSIQPSQDIHKIKMALCQLHQISSSQSLKNAGSQHSTAVITRINKVLIHCWRMYCPLPIKECKQHERKALLSWPQPTYHGGLHTWTCALTRTATCVVKQHLFVMQAHLLCLYAKKRGDGKDEKVLGLST